MKKKIISLGISAAFVLAVFSGCAAMRRNRTEINAYDTTDRSLVREYEDSRMYDPTGVDFENNAVITRRPLTVDNLASFIGMHETDLNTAFGARYRLNGTGPAAGRVYNNLLYGRNTDFNVNFDDGSRVETISVTASRAQAARWQRELNSRYGTGITGDNNMGEWFANGARISMIPLGDNVRITISNTL